MRGEAEEGQPRPARVGGRRFHGRRGAAALGVLISRVFLLSPANCGGTRAKQILSPRATFALALALRSDGGAPLGDVFAFVSGLYFRGKLTYARRFASPPERGNTIVGAGIHIITPTAGLRGPDTLIGQEAIRAFGRGDIDAGNARYRRPLEASARALAAEIGPDCDVVLLGSVASPKYVEVLTSIFGERLRFPPAFVGRGDMSRGGLLLRHASDGVELEYTPIVGAVLHGKRPPKLTPLRTWRRGQDGREGQERREGQALVRGTRVAGRNT